MSAAEIGFGVSPGNLNFTLSPGESTEASLSILNTGPSTAKYLVSIDNEVYAGWFEITPSNFELQPGQERQVTVKLSVPPSAPEDADCKIELLQTSDTNVLAGVRVPVHVEVVTSNEPLSREPSGVFSSGTGITDDRNLETEKKQNNNSSESGNEKGQTAEKSPGFPFILAGADLAVLVFLLRNLLNK